MESISGKLIVYHTEMGSILYSGKLARAFALESIFFYDSLYIFPIAPLQYGKVQQFPPPTLSSIKWSRLNLDIVASYKLRFACDIQNAMKASKGTKGVHLSWLFPISSFVHFFASCIGLMNPTFSSLSISSLTHFA